MDKLLRAKLERLAEEHGRLSEAMFQPEVASNPEVYREHAQAKSALDEAVRLFERYQGLEARSAEATAILRDESDGEIRAMAAEELEELTPQLEDIERAIKLELLPRDPNDAKNTIVEIRAGTGGDEAGLFAADLFRMYSRFADLKGWKIEVLSRNETELGGFKEISFQITGDMVYSQLKWEGGVHRVQRVPETETQGRVHTSAVTVAVLPEAEEVDVQVDPGDLQIDVYRASGAGGQHVNTTDSAVRITHRPTGLVVTCQDERSQHKNRTKAMRILLSRLLALRQEEEAATRSEDRRSQVGSGDRSERIRTYNFPQNRLTDHRIGLTLYSLEQVMQGAMQEVVDALMNADRAAKLAASA